MEESKFMNKYPFLEDNWNKYKFDEDMTFPKDYKFYSVCNSITGISKNFKSELEQSEICTKFLRNLKALYDSSGISNEELNKKCMYIYYWLYYEMKEQIDYKEYIEKIFEKLNNPIEKPSNNDGCYNLKLYEYFDETKVLVMLSIFNDNINDILAILNQNGNSNLSSCKEFIKECADLYKSMYKEHCSNGENTEDTKISFTCNIVKKFKELYCSYIYNKLPKYNEFQDLSYNTTINYVEGCQSKESQSDQVPTVQSNKSDHSIIQSVPPALGLMAGIPPLLVLIYKFTPARSWINWNLRRSRKGISNNLHGDEGNEILFNGNVHSEFNPYNIKYEAA